MKPLGQHQQEIHRNRLSWAGKPVLHKIYAGFYDKIVALIDPAVPGPVVEIGAGMGHLKSRLPDALSTDLFAHDWLDVICDGYELPFAEGSLSHLVLCDVFHHFKAPRAFLREAGRVLHPRGRLILFEPFVSLCSFPVYGWLHHEPVGWHHPINAAEQLPRPRGYYAAQGNATRLFFLKQSQNHLKGWVIFHAQALSAFSYFLSGGYSKPSLIRTTWLPSLLKLDSFLSRWPSLFGGRCVVGLSRLPSPSPAGG